MNEAVTSPEMKHWEKSIQEEFENLERNNASKLIKRREGIKTIRSRWTFRRKRDQNGKVIRYKARLVALGKQQRPGIDYGFTYSPVVKMKTTRLVMVIAVQKGCEVHHVDVVAAYLTAKLKEKFYMEFPKGIRST